MGNAAAYLSEQKKSHFLFWAGRLNCTLETTCKSGCRTNVFLYLEKHRSVRKQTLVLHEKILPPHSFQWDHCRGAHTEGFGKKKKKYRVVWQKLWTWLKHTFLVDYFTWYNVIIWISTSWLTRREDKKIVSVITFQSCRYICILEADVSVLLYDNLQTHRSILVFLDCSLLVWLLFCLSTFRSISYFWV